MAALTVPWRCKASNTATPSGPQTTASASSVNDRAVSLAFCPDCGAPNIHLHFAREVVLVREQVELAVSLASDQRELAYRLMGNAHEDVLTAFEATRDSVSL